MTALYQIYKNLALGLGFDIARVAVIYHKTKPLLMSDASPTFLSALWRKKVSLVCFDGKCYI